MRRWRAVLFALLASSLGGCFTGQPDRSTGLFDPERPFSGPLGEDVVQLDIVLVERPLGDTCLDRGVWLDADEQANLDRKALLEANGFRVGQLGGTLPSGLQALLVPRNCPEEPHRVRLHAGTANPVVLGPTRKHCRFRLTQDDHSLEVDLDDARCVLAIVPSLAEDGRLVLRCTPHVKHGKPTLAPRPVQEPSGARRWDWEAQEPEETYAWLGWELTVGQNEYVVLGTRYDWSGTLGHAFFVPQTSEAPVQRLLLIRAASSPTGAPELDEQLVRSPPLAVQATWTTARGSRP